MRVHVSFVQYYFSSSPSRISTEQCLSLAEYCLNKKKKEKKKKEVLHKFVSHP